jgi:hypothetical protein
MSRASANVALQVTAKLAPFLENRPQASGLAVSTNDKPLAVHNPLQPCADVGNRLVHSVAQFYFNCVQLCHHAFLRRRALLKETGKAV